MSLSNKLHSNQKAVVSLSVSLVVYKPNLQVLGNTLFALQHAVQFAKNDYEILFELSLVDNSRDAIWHEHLQIWIEEHIDMIPDLMLRLVGSSENVGYGRGNNLIIEHIKSDFHLVINPDLFVETGGLSQALRFMLANPDVGLLVPAVFGEDREQHYLCKSNPTLFIMFLRSFAPRWIQSRYQSMLLKFEMRDKNYNEPIDGVQFPSGCFMFFRTRFLRQLNGFDPDYFMYFEDADIGRRMLKIARVVYVPSVRVVHQWARGSHRFWNLRWAMIWSAFIYWSKWGGVF